MSFGSLPLTKTEEKGNKQDLIIFIIVMILVIILIVRG